MNTQDSINNEKVPQPMALSIDRDCSCESHGSQKPSIGLGAIAALTAATALASCRKDPETLFEVNDVLLLDDSASKDKEKTNQQYVSILYTNLFQTALSSNDVFELDRCLQSIGDQVLAKEVLISNFFNQDGVEIPSVEEMNADIESFIEDTYKRFFVRLPNEAEKTWIKNFIQSNPYMKPELVYFSFALSNEYLFY